MGSPVLYIVQLHYMENFEQRALAEADDSPRWWKRYVSDTYTILKKDQSQTFADYLNAISDDIKWMMEGKCYKKSELRTQKRGWRDAWLSWTLCW